MVFGPMVCKCPVSVVLFESAYVMKQCRCARQMDAVLVKAEALGYVGSLFADPQGMVSFQFDIVAVFCVFGPEAASIFFEPFLEIFQFFFRDHDKNSITEEQERMKQDLLIIYLCKK